MHCSISGTPVAHRAVLLKSNNRQSEMELDTPMSNVISLRSYKAFKELDTEELAYQARILSMNKVELLEEMVRFQEERKTLGTLTHPLMVRGRYLFRALEESADSQELKILSRSYRRHLDHEIQAHREKTQGH